MGFSNSRIVLHFLLLFSIYIGGAVTQDTKVDTPPPADLGDRDDYYPWVQCDAGELCLQKRTHRCTNSSSPHLSCGNLVWKEELLGCYVCAQDVWHDVGDWSKCVGVGCKGTVQSFSRTCANKAVNPNCNLIQTRYCNADLICDGQWASWTTEDPECQDQCGQSSRNRVMERTCMKNGTPSSSCATPTPSSPFVENLIDDCKASPCPTTTDPPPTTVTTASTAAAKTTTKTTTVTTTVPTTSTTISTTTLPITLSPWSKWNGCTATCKNLEGMEKRTRKCIDQDGNESPPTSCGEDALTQERKCQLKNVGKCKKTIKITTTTEGTTQKTTTVSTIKVVESKPPKGNGRNLGVPEPVTTAPGNTSINSTSALSEESSMLKNEHKILIIVLVITSCLIAIVLIIYMYLLKKKKQRGAQNKVRDISVVGLQSHTGFMQGMEKYGFPKSTVPVGDFFASMDPAATNRYTETPAKTDDIQQRELPQKPLESSFVETNPNPSHIYEDMRLTSSEHDLLTPSTPLMRRSLSYNEKMHRSRGYTLGVQDMKARRSLRLASGYQRRKSLAPPKPPRRFTMANSGNERYASSETREVPKYLYSPKNKASLPDLEFINHINPPLHSPPISPEEPKNSLAIPNLATQAHSAPASPNRAQYGVLPPSPFLTPVIFQYNGMQLMAPVQSQNGGVVYMPFSPVYPSSPNFQIGQSLQGTPLHGTEVTLRHNPKKAQRPKTMSFVPQISISEVDSHLLSPNNSVKSPLSGDYTEMRHSQSPDFEDGDLMSVRTKSFTHLHGTQNMDRSHNEQSDENFNKVSAEDSEPPEDKDGYLVPTRV